MEDLLSRIDSTLARDTLVDLGYRIEEVEETLAVELLQECKDIIQRDQPAILQDRGELTLDGSFVRVDLVPDFRIRGNRGLVLKVEHRGSCRAILSRGVFDLQQPGAVRQLEILSNLDWEASFEKIGAFFCQVFNGAYHCISCRLADQTARSVTVATNRLYGQIRSRLPAELQFEVWLFAVRDIAGFYLLDPLASDFALKRLAKNMMESHKSPILAFAEFATHIPDADRDTFLSLGVVKTSAIVDGTFKDVDYSLGVKAAQAALYESEHFTVQALVRDGEYGLTACYPSEYRSVIEPILESQRQRLTAILIQETKQIGYLQRKLDDFRNPSLDGALLGEFVGGMLKSLLKPG